MEEFFMSKNTNLEEEIIFFDAEIVEDDGDEDIPMGTLVNAPAMDEVATDKENEVENDTAPAETVAEDEPVIEEAPVDEQPTDVAPVEEAPAPAVTEDTAPAPKKKAPQKAKATTEPKATTAPKKQVNEADIWGVAVINTKKPKQEKPVEEPKAEEKKPAPKKKATEPKAEQKEDVKPAPKKAPAKVEERKADTTPVEEPKTKTTKNTTKKTSEEEPKVAKETKAPEETIITEGTREYHGKFIIKKTDNGHFVYKLFAYGNKCVAIGAQPYADLGGAKGGIASVAKNAGIETIIDLTKAPEGKLPCPRWEIYEDKKGEFRLRLIATNGNLVATTNDGYTTKAAAKKGIESVAKAADGAAVVRNDNAW